MGTYIFAKLNLFFAAPGDCNLPDHSFFFIPNWWKYLLGDRDDLNKCVPVIDFASHPEHFWLIGLAILDMLLRLAGFLAVVSIIIAGIELIASEGNTEKAVNARNRIINSLKGLALAVIAISSVAFIGSRIGGSANSYGLPNTPVDSGSTALADVFNIVFVIVGAMAFLFIVIAGLRFILARGEPTKIAEARKQIAYAAIGLILVVAAASIVNVVLAMVN